MSKVLNILLPKGWGDMSPSLFVDYLRRRGRHGEDVARMQIWRAYHRSSYDQVMRWDVEDAADIISSVLSAMDWLHTPPTSSPIASFARSRSLFAPKVKLYFPEDRMETSTLREFILADERYTSIVSTLTEGDEDQATRIEKDGLRLLATLARPLSRDMVQYLETGDRRIPIQSEYHAMSLAEGITRTDREIYIHTAILYFTGVKQWIYDHYGPILFGDAPADALAPQVDLGWHSHTAAVARQGVFGHHVEDVMETNLHRFLLHLVDEIQKSNKSQKR